MYIVQVKVLNFCANMDYTDVYIERCGNDLNSVLENIECSEILQRIYGELETEIKISKADLVGGVLLPIKTLSERTWYVDYNITDALTGNTDITDSLLEIEKRLLD